MFLFIGVILYRSLVRPLCKQGDDCAKSSIEFQTWYVFVCDVCDVCVWTAVVFNNY